MFKLKNEWNDSNLRYAMVALIGNRQILTGNNFSMNEEGLKFMTWKDYWGVDTLVIID